MDAPLEPVPHLVTSSGQFRSPGPAAYNTRRDLISDVPRISLHGRVAICEEHCDVPFRALPTCIGTGRKFTLQSRHDPPQEATPGSEYLPPRFASDLPARSFHSRLPPLKVDDTPGPGHYAAPAPLGSSAPKATLHGPRDRSFPVAAGDSPGPGGYQTAANGPVVLPIRIGRRFPAREPEATPGPGAYESARPRPRAASFGVRPAVRDPEGSPGPGSYGIGESFLAGTPRLYFHGRLPEPRPEPGAPYRDVARDLGGPKYSMRSRYKQVEEVTPGCDYMPLPFGSGLAKRTIAPRWHREAVHDGPGPGVYRAGWEIGCSARRASFHGAGDRGPPVDGDRSPGPAQYAPAPDAIGKRGPRFTMKGARYEPKRDPTGEYTDLGSTMEKPKRAIHARPPLDSEYG